MTEPADGFDIQYIANLARIPLSPEEAATFGGQLREVLAHIEQLQELDVDGVEPTAHAVPVHNVFRADEERPGLDPERVAENFPETRAGHVMVPRIIE